MILIKCLVSERQPFPLSSSFKGYLMGLMDEMVVLVPSSGSIHVLTAHTPF